MSKIITDYDAIVIGAGFSGIRSLWELDRLGLTVRCFDTASDVGGTWFWNRYPGAQTDGESSIYLLNFAPDLLEEWNFRNRFPTQEEIQLYLSRIADRYDLRKHIEFGTKIAAAHYSDKDKLWNIITANGTKKTCRYFLPATGVLSVPKPIDIAGLKTFSGEVYRASKWPAHKISLENKRIAIVGTGSTGVHIIPKLGHIAEHLTVFQRTPNYVLPARDHSIDEYESADIKNNHDSIWEMASQNLAGHAFRTPGRILKGLDATNIKQVLDSGWEKGGFYFQLETFGDIFMDPESNEVAAEYIRQKIRAIVHDQDTAELLCPKHLFGAKRTPAGSYYYETFNKRNVKLVDISQQDIELYEKGIRTGSGTEHEVDIIIMAVGFDAGTGAMNQIDIKGTNGTPLRDFWNKKLETFAGVLVPDFPNMFIVCGPHMPIGNLPTFLEPGMNWIGKIIHHMETNKFATINVSKKAAQRWTDHVEGIWNSSLLGKSATEQRSWFAGTNIPGRTARIMFYFGGLPTWRSLLEEQVAKGWADMEFMRYANDEERNGHVV
ncbi:cyclohexanone monooxygenase [Phaeosphaeriaceae sp. PMI808]|nr:cyclohexanone monooxygenase [Phaeosphaeriaceae sp. PMI808]